MYNFRPTNQRFVGDSKNCPIYEDPTLDKLKLEIKQQHSSVDLNVIVAELTHRKWSGSNIG